MTRIATRNVRSSKRPDPLGGGLTSQQAGRVVPILTLPTSHRIGYGPAAGVPQDARPDTIGAHDAIVLRREEAFRTRELTDLPDEGELW